MFSKFIDIYLEIDDFFSTFANMIFIQDISIYFTGESLFEGVSFIIKKNDKIGLTGKNGVGKTTLLRLIAGEQETSAGVISRAGECKVGYLPQEKNLNQDGSIIEETLKAFSEIINLKSKINSINKEISKRDDFHSQDYLALLQKLHDANERFDILDGSKIYEESEKVLKGLGFEQTDFDKSVNTLSGGWKMRIELAKILLAKPDVLLLDEPTNHLDIESIQWLEEYLSRSSVAIVLVSHDRTFLDKVTNRTIEIMNKRIYDYNANYSDYLELRKEQMEVQKGTYENQQAQIAHIEKFIERFRYKSTKARQVQSRVKMLEKIDIVEVDQFDTSAIQFHFQKAPRSGRVVVDLQNISKSYGEKNVLKSIDFAAERGESIAFVGRNGEGKTTLAKIIAGNLDFEGSREIGHNVKIGYFDQNQTSFLNPELTVFQTIDDLARNEMRTKVRAILGSFLFDNDDIDKKVKVLSGGEKTRLALACMLLEPYNFLILDEPTNHLDMVSKDVLKNALIHYDGTIIIVSHDRDFLQGLTDKVVEFRDKSIKTYLGDIQYFMETKSIESLKEIERQEAKNSSKTENQSSQKIVYQQRKEIEREIRKATNNVQNIEAKISDCEEKLQEIEKKLSSPENLSDSDKIEKLYVEYNNIKTNIDNLFEQWHEASLELENLKSFNA